MHFKDVNCMEKIKNWNGKYMYIVYRDGGSLGSLVVMQDRYIYHRPLLPLLPYLNPLLIPLFSKGEEEISFTPHYT